MMLLCLWIDGFGFMILMEVNLTVEFILFLFFICLFQKSCDLTTINVSYSFYAILFCPYLVYDPCCETYCGIYCGPNHILVPLVYIALALHSSPFLCNH